MKPDIGPAPDLRVSLGAVELASPLVGSSGLWMQRPGVWMTAAWVGLVIVLVLKIRREERFLLRVFPEYAAYSRRTWRLVPRVY